MARMLTFGNLRGMPNWLPAMSLVRRMGLEDSSSRGRGKRGFPGSPKRLGDFGLMNSDGVLKPLPEALGRGRIEVVEIDDQPLGRSAGSPHATRSWRSSLLLCRPWSGCFPGHVKRAV